MKYMSKEKVDEKSSNKALILTGLIILVFVVGLLTNGFGLFSAFDSSGNGEYIALAIEDSPVIGDANAPVTIYEFSDFSCPYCAAAAGENPVVMGQLSARNSGWEAPVPKIIENYVNTGKVKMVFKYTTGHGSGQPAHIVSLAMAEQGLFKEFHNAAFANQAEVSSLGSMLDLAESLGADREQLEEDIDNNNYRAQILREEQMGRSNGVGGTPSFFINGQKIEGAASYSVFEQVIESELN